MTEKREDRVSVARNDRPLGAEVRDFVAPPAPGAVAIPAVWAQLRRLSAVRDAGAVSALTLGRDELWDYMPNGPYHDEGGLRDWMRQAESAADPCFYSIFGPDRPDQALGYASFMRVDRNSAVIEIGNIMLSPALQGHRTGSAALMAMIGWAFGQGYRRVEWKCNALNAPSRRAALRLGFSFEGVFRQHMIVKGRNRDTAWFAITDRDWRLLSPAYATWLAADNFDENGNQRQRLSALTASALPGRRDG